jgi:hypothetical protein
MPRGQAPHPLHTFSALSDDTFARALETAYRTGGRDVAELRAAVTAHVRRAKARQAPPQEVIVSLKAALHRVPAPDVAQWDLNALAARAVGWGIEEYYRGR